MNTELLLKAKQSILDHPETLNMEKLGFEYEEADSRGPHECGTTCCIMGWVMWHHGPERWPFNSRTSDASKALCISEDSAYDLFFGNWHTDVKSDRPFGEETAEEAAKAIDHFIANNGWEDND